MLKILTGRVYFDALYLRENILDDFESHKNSAIEYKKFAKKWSEHNFTVCLQQLGALGGLYFVSNMEAHYVKPLGIILGLISLFFIGKDYVTLKSLDKEVVEILLVGLDLEKKNSKLKRFFHDVVQKFSIVKILTTRAISTALFVSILATRMKKILLNESYYSENNRMIIGIIVVVVGAITCGLYYQFFKPLEKEKRSILRKYKIG